MCHQRHPSVVAAAMPVRVEALLARSMHDARFRELHKTLPRNPDVRLRRTRKAHNQKVVTVIAVREDGELPI